MKKGFLLFGLLGAFTFSGVAQQNFGAHILQLKANDLVYDSVTQRIYATIPSANGSNGNSIGVINPATYTLDTTVFAGSEPTIMAISGDGQYIYAGSSASSVIRRFNIPTLRVDKTIQLGSNTLTGALYANDIEVMPGAPLVIAVSLKNKGFTPSHEGIAIYDDGVKRPTATPGHTGSDQIEFAAGQIALLFGYDNQSSEAGLRTHTISTTGIVINNVYKRLFAGFFGDFISVPGTLYSTTGTAVDVTGTPYVAGQFGDVNGPVAYDEDAKKVCYASSNRNSLGNSYFVFRRFHPNTYLQSDSTAFPQLLEKPLKLITCGPDCYALNTNGGKVIILKPQPISVQEYTYPENNALWHPNPAGNFIALNEPQKVAGITIVSLDGRAVLRSREVQSPIDISALATGVYQVIVAGKDGQQTIQKLLKK